MLVALKLGTLAAQSPQEAARRNAALDLPVLSAADKAELAEVLRLQAALGDGAGLEDLLREAARPEAR